MLAAWLILRGGSSVSRRLLPIHGIRTKRKDRWLLQELCHAVAAKPKFAIILYASRMATVASAIQADKV